MVPVHANGEILADLPLLGIDEWPQPVGYQLYTVSNSSSVTLKVTLWGAKASVLK